MYTFPKLSFYIDVKGGESIDYKIVEMPAFKFAGVSKRVYLQRWMKERKIMPIVKFGCLYVRKDRKDC